MPKLSFLRWLDAHPPFLVRVMATQSQGRGRRKKLLKTEEIAARTGISTRKLQCIFGSVTWAGVRVKDVAAIFEAIGFDPRRASKWHDFIRRDLAKDLPHLDAKGRKRFRRLAARWLEEVSDSKPNNGDSRGWAHEQGASD